MPLAPWLPREVTPVDPTTVRLLNPVIASRYSGRILSPESLNDEEVESLLRAVQWAPSCGNAQPWHLVCARSPEGLDRARRCLTRGNRWAHAAPLLIIVAGRTEDARVMEDGRQYLLFDLGLATQNLILQAAHLGLIAHPMAGFDPALARELLQIPEEYTIVCFIAVGRPAPASVADPETLAKDRQPRVRKPFEEWVHWNRW